MAINCKSNLNNICRCAGWSCNEGTGSQTGCAGCRQIWYKSHSGLEEGKWNNAHTNEAETQTWQLVIIVVLFSWAFPLFQKIVLCQLFVLSVGVKFQASYFISFPASPREVLKQQSVPLLFWIQNYLTFKIIFMVSRECKTWIWIRESSDFLLLLLLFFVAQKTFTIKVLFQCYYSLRESPVCFNRMIRRRLTFFLIGR